MSYFQGYRGRRGPDGGPGAPGNIVSIFKALYFSFHPLDMNMLMIFL